MIPPILSYYGGKHRIAGRYPRPRYDHIIEPFAGSAGYACRYHDLRVTLVERDRYVAEALDYVVRAAPEEIVRLPILGPDETLDDHSELEAGARNLISFWLNNGTATGARRLSQWAIRYPGNSFYWGAKTRERLAEASARIKHWKVVCGDYTSAPDVWATWFIDPPYQGAGKHYRFNFDENKRRLLADWCRARRGQVIVCENEGATWLPFERLCTIAGTAKRGAARKKSVEVIWTNDPKENA